MPTVGRLKNSDLSIIGELNERLPIITDGLVSHFPFDGQGGTFSGVSGDSTYESMENGLNLIEALSINWREPNAWTSQQTTLSEGVEYIYGMDALKLTGYRQLWLKTPIVVDPNKEYRISIEVFLESNSTTGGDTYIGGLSLNANKEKTTKNYDYSLSAYKAPVGQWVTYRVTRKGTAVAPNGQSYSFNTVKGWGGDLTTGVDILAKYYHLGGLFNYIDATGVTYIRNPRIEVVSSDSSNAVVNEDGLHIGLASKNISPSLNGKCGVYNNHSFAFTNIPTGWKYLGMPVYKMTFTIANATQLNSVRERLWGQGVIEEPLDYKAKTKYACSIYWKSLSHPNMLFGGIASNTSGWRDGGSIALENGWNRHFRFRDGTATADVNDRVFHSFQLPTAEIGDVVSFLYACPQIEEGFDYPTPYMKPGTSRTAKSKVSLDSSVLNWNAGTITFKFRPSKWGTVTLDRIFSIYDKYTSTNVLDGLSVIAVPGGIYAEFCNSAGVRFATNSLPLPPLGEWETITVRWLKLATYGQLVINVGDKTETINIPLANFPTAYGTFLIGDAIGFDRLSPGSFKDFSIYNRSLSNAELDTLKGSKFKVNSKGDLITPKLKEAPVIETDNEVYHFPLTINAEEARGRFKPSNATNLTFSGEGAYHRNVNEKNYADLGVEGFISNHTYERKGNRHIFVRQGANSQPVTILQSELFQKEVAQGTAYTVSGYLYVNGKPFQTPTSYVSSNNPRATRKRSEPNGYFEFTQLFDTVTPYVIATDFTNGNNPIGTVVELRDLCIRALPYALPYTKESTGISTLEFNLHNDIKLDWRKSWSIVYWMKPYTTTNNALTSYSLSSLGGNDNTVGGGYVWWGKINREDFIYQSTPASITPENYFGNWRMISLVKSGTTLTIKEWDYFGNVHFRTVPFNVSNANYFVTPRGYDLKLSGFDTSTSSSILRDLIVAKRAFTNAEVENLFKKQLSLSKEGVKLSGRLKEGYIH